MSRSASVDDPSLRFALEAGQIGVWEWDMAQDEIAWSEGACDLVGLTPATRDARLADYLDLTHRDDRDAVHEAIEAVRAGRSSTFRVEHRITRADGTAPWVELRGRLAPGHADQSARLIGTVTSVTARRTHESQIHRVNRALRAVSAGNQVIARAGSEQELLDDFCRVLCDVGGYRIAWIGRVESTAPVGGSLVAFAGVDETLVAAALDKWRRIESLDGPVSRAILTGVPDACRDYLTDPRVANWRPEVLALGVRSALAIPFAFEEHTQGVVALYDAEPGAFDEAERGLLRELAEDLAHGIRLQRERAARATAEASLAASETLLRQFIRYAPASVAMFDLEMQYLSASDRWLADFNLQDAPIIGRSFYEVYPAAPTRWREVHARVLGGAVERCDAESFIRADGTQEWLEWEMRPWTTADGDVGGAMLFIQFITARRRQQDALHVSEERFRSAMLHSPIGMSIVAPDGTFREVNPAFCRLVGYCREELVGRPFASITHPDDLGANIDQVQRMLDGETEIAATRKRYLRKDASVCLVELRTSLVRNAKGAPQHFISQVEDITERVAAERALRESEERFRQVVENLEAVFWMSDARDHRLLYVSPMYERVWGITAGSTPASWEAWCDLLHPDDRARVLRDIHGRQQRGEYAETFRIIRPDGSMRWVRDRAFPIRDADGNVCRIAGIAEDVTEQRQVEEQLRQSQKLEAIGQLAGGVAHDFNNILSAMMMQVEEIAGFPQLPVEVPALLQDLLASTERAAGLTRQLLAFSRRQVMMPRSLDLNEVAARLSTLLHRVLGEDVRLRMLLARDPLPAFGDPGMLEQVLLNLAVNARDAMPDGGVLTIETAPRVLVAQPGAVAEDLPAGPYVALRVSDTGTGIPLDVQPRIFEPFYTTKEPGKGTGLGLATVFGIVKQHGGTVRMQSEPGHGSAFEVLLPAHAEVATTDPRGGTPVSTSAVRGNGESILVVEDDVSVRRMLCSALRRHGYQPIAAMNGLDALDIWDAHDGGFDLLFTDLVMPEGISGRELSERLLERRPGLRVIFTSGYSAELAGRAMILEEGQNFLQKPCPVHEILRTVRRVLDA